MEKNKKTVYVIGTNHFDPIWRRGFKKPYYYKGQKFVGASVIEDACLTEWLEMSEKSDSTFEVECSMVLRNYLENHPEKQAEFQRLMDENRFELLACGEIIPDTNMPGGETLVRNLVYGILWAENTFGYKPTTGNLNDAFGSSAQMPQIFKGCGVNWLTGLTYKFPIGEYWRGLDGTKIKITPNMQYEWLGMAKYLSGGTYYRPCPKCNGEGCDECKNRGFQHSFRMGAVPDADGLDLEKNGFGAIYVGGEETLADERLPEYVAQANEQQDEVEYRFGLHKEIGERYFKHKIENTENCPEEEVAAEVEGNPIQTGVYVSRIKTKQEVRRLENRALAAEKLASLAFGDSEQYPSDTLLEIWRIISFASFHDNITGTHVDVGYEELLENYAKCHRLIDQVEAAAQKALTVEEAGKITVFNPHSFPCSQYITAQNGKRIYAESVPAGGFKTLSISEASEYTEVPVDGQNTMENEYYRVTFDNHGIIGIYDKLAQKELIRTELGYANELILENDFGDPWSTREEDRKRTPMGRMNTLVSIRKTDFETELVYRGTLKGNERLLEDPLDYRVLKLEWEQRICLRYGERKVDFKTDILWDAFDRRIRIAFPTYMTDDEGDYAVPYGTLRRAKYDKEARKGVGVADGDWPAVEWFATAKRKSVNMALINTGTPSSRIEKGTMLMSVLRSPTFPSCLFWPNCYYAPVYDGMRDRGQHSFAYSFTSYQGEWNENDVYQMAQTVNMPLIVWHDAVPAVPDQMLPEISSNSSVISACKKAEDGNGMILRIFEFKGMSDEVTIRLPEGYASACECNLLEESKENIAVEHRTARVAMRGFEIKTLRLTRDERRS